MTVSEVIDAANKNNCQIFVNGTHYEIGVIVEGSVELWETRDRFNDNEAADLSYPSDSTVRIVAGCAVLDGEDDSIELYQLTKFPIL